MMTQLKKRKMDKEKVLGVVNEVIVDKLTQLIEEMKWGVSNKIIRTFLKDISIPNV